MRSWTCEHSTFFHRRHTWKLSSCWSGPRSPVRYHVTVGAVTLEVEIDSEEIRVDGDRIEACGPELAGANVYSFLVDGKSHTVLASHHQLFYEAVAVLVFFTVRSIPETTTASFSVDLMVMVPVLAFLEILFRKYILRAEG